MIITAYILTTYDDTGAPLDVSACFLRTYDNSLKI